MLTEESMDETREETRRRSAGSLPPAAGEKASQPDGREPLASKETLCDRACAIGGALSNEKMRFRNGGIACNCGPNAANPLGLSLAALPQSFQPIFRLMLRMS